MDAKASPKNAHGGFNRLIDALRLEALELSRGLGSTPANIARVAKRTSDEAAPWAFGQWDLRQKAKAKFERADEMLFVREALEQATHERVAAYHASRFPEGALVADLTAGIGADLIALAARGPVIGYELDPDRAECATWNLGGGGGETVRIADSLLVEWPFDYAFADPARRVEGRRTLDPDDFSPDPVELARKMERLLLGGIKLSPMLPDPFLASLGPCLEFVSFDGECREALVWTGARAHQGRWAVHVESGERLPTGVAAAILSEPKTYLYEADPAAIRAHALGSLCDRFDLRLLGDSNGYLTGDGAAKSSWIKGYRVLYSGKADLKSTKRALRDLGADVPEIKQRGAGIDLPKFRKEFTRYGSRKVYLAVWPVERSLRHTIVEPI